MLQKYAARFGAALLFAVSVLASAFGQMPNPYGAAISLENAKKAAAPAIAEAVKNNWAMAVAIVDPSGNLVYYEKMDNTQIGSANVAIEKARSAALFKRPTKTYQDALAAGEMECAFCVCRARFLLRGNSDFGRRQDRWSDRCVWRDRAAGRPVREGGSGRHKIGLRNHEPESDISQKP